MATNTAVIAFIAIIMFSMVAIAAIEEFGPQEPACLDTEPDQ